MDWRPSDGLEVDDEDLDGLRQKPSNGPEAMLVIPKPAKDGKREGVRGLRVGRPGALWSADPTPSRRRLRFPFRLRHPRARRRSAM
ncbi:hypothetical protein U9M48_019489 [Paspalum notatum var. saurae]|uniref:Uncharacterized protein n=1 Tax=Paspalum notatum var. saurae TaxID=547442 RepID=A0AAQ3TFH4_PASNO